MLVGIALLDVFQKTPHQFTPGGKDGQTNHDEKYSLENWEEKTKNPKPNKNPANA